MELCKYSKIGNVKVFEIAMVQAVEPLVIRANVGDCIKLRITNTDTETVVERFFISDKPETILLHDQLFNNINKQYELFGALIIEEIGTTFHNPKDGKELYSGTQAVIRRENGTAFREFVLFVNDLGINYRAEPMKKRLCKKEDLAYIFSSYIHGDPTTPILETYPRDELIIRLINGTDEAKCSLNIMGMSWRKELADIKPTFTSSQIFSFNFNITEKYGAGDYLYYLGEIDDAWRGLWGIIRVHKKYIKNLKPLYQEKDIINALPFYPSKNEVIRRYEVVAVHNSDKLIFVSLKDINNVLAGKHIPKPMILRANKGEWIEVTLHNALDLKHPIPHFSYPRVPVNKEYKPSMRVSMNPQFLRYDPIYNSGINVGYNEMEQTVGVGETKRYLWYADKEYGVCAIQSFGDIQNHRYNGLFGAIIVE